MNVDFSNYKLDESDGVFTYKNENTTLGFVRFNDKGEIEIIWDGRNSSGSIVANGVYFCKLTSNNQDYWTKLVVVN